MKHRVEIDGLRAIAVLPVIFFHAGFNVFSGGYVGVDVFFVLSGYLITGIILSDISQNQFSVAYFYERRARRILPALYFVMMACLPFAYWWMTPLQFKDFAQSLVATVFFGSNILFWRETGYFLPDAESKPLLHTWSLAVEEQFYIIFPLVVLFCWRYGRTRLFWGIVAAAVASLFATEWAWRNTPNANFFLLPTRAWELLAGSICAFLTFGRRPTPHNSLSAIGLASIVISIFLFDSSTPFPSLYTVVPVAGTAMIILYGCNGTWVARLLSLRVLVGVGLISYSAYLWHQPLFAFARIRSMHEPVQVLMTGLAVLALFLAWGTWRWVEQPFRTKVVFRKQSSLFAASAAVGVFFVAAGVSGHVGKGFEGRFSDEQIAFVNSWQDMADGRCIFLEFSNVPSHPVASCLSTPETESPSIMLIGDSHSAAISGEISSQLREIGIEHYRTSWISCLPFTNVKRFDIRIDDGCVQFVEDAFDYAERVNIETIVLTARFPMYIHGLHLRSGAKSFHKVNTPFVDVVDRTASHRFDPTRQARVLEAYEAAIRKLAERFNVVLVYPIPEIKLEGARIRLQESPIFERYIGAGVFLFLLRGAYTRGR